MHQCVMWLLACSTTIAGIALLHKMPRSQAVDAEIMRLQRGSWSSALNGTSGAFESYRGGRVGWVSSVGCEGRNLLAPTFLRMVIGTKGILLVVRG